MNLNNEPVSHITDFRAPNRKRLHQTERFTLPVSSLLMLFIFIWASYDTAAWWGSIILGGSSILLMGLTLFAYNKPQAPFVQHLNLARWVGSKSGSKLSVALLLIITLAFLNLSRHTENYIPLFFGLPAFFIPLILYVQQQQYRSISRRWAGGMIFWSFLVFGAGSLSVLAKPTEPLFITWRFPGRLGTDAPSTLIAFSVYILLGMFLTYYVLRRQQLIHLGTETIQNVIVKLLDVEDPQASLQDVAQIILDDAGLGERIVFLHHDAETDTVRVAASAGKHTHAVVGTELPRERGLAREAIRTKTLQYASDVTQDARYFSGGLPNHGSEISVPILVREAGQDSVWGALNIQENFKNGFTEQDKRVALILSSIITGVAHRYPGNFNQQFNVHMQQLNRLSTPESTGDYVVSMARDLFDSSVVCYYRLGHGTGIPIQCTLSQETSIPEFYQADLMRDLDSDLVRWIEMWEPKFIHHMKAQPNLQNVRKGFGDYFQTHEKVHSLCFLPIGTRSNRVGVILLGFHEPKLFSRTARMNLLAFAREIMAHLEKVNFKASIRSGFARAELPIHSMWAEATLGRGNPQLILQEVLEVLDEASPLYETVGRLSNGLQIFQKRIRSWNEWRTSLYYLGDEFPIKAILADWCAKKQQLFDVTIIRGIDSLIEKENRDLQMILCILVMEAVTNSIVNGEARVVNVHIKRCDYSVVIEMSDDGVGFDPKQARVAHDKSDFQRLKVGIFDLEEVARRFLCALPIDWLDTAPGRGTRFVWEIPMLPLKI